jgi:hypothetical protein
MGGRFRRVPLHYQGMTCLLPKCDPPKREFFPLKTLLTSD